MEGQRLQKLRLGLGQALRRAVARQLQPLHVKGRAAQPDLLGPDWLAAGPPEDRVYAQRQLARLERLGHVIVGSARETLDPVVGVAAGGQEQHGGARQLGLAPHPAGQVQAALAGHHDVQHHQVELDQLHQPARRRSVRRARHAIAFARQELLQQFADAVVVVDDQQVAADPRAGDGTRAAVGARIGHAHRAGPSHEALTSAAPGALTPEGFREMFFNGLRSFRRP